MDRQALMIESSGNRYCLLLVLAACPILVSGCGNGSKPDETTTRIVPDARTPPAHPKLAVGAKVRDCDIVFDGPGPADWRKRSLWIGPLGLAGPGPGPNFDEGAREGGLLLLKTISVPEAQRYRVGILGVHRRPAYASVTYVPCDDKPRTVFAAGFANCLHVGGSIPPIPPRFRPAMELGSADRHRRSAPALE